MQPTDLKPDCSRCAGLCCMAYDLVEGPDFAFDKPAGTACRHLRADNRCAIHGRLRAAGFGGCASYDCLGAGQRVCNQVLAGLDWRRSESERDRLIAALKALRAVHENLQLVMLTDRFGLSADQRAERQVLLGRLDPPGGWTEEALAGFAQGGLAAACSEFLRGLRPQVGRRRQY